MCTLVGFANLRFHLSDSSWYRLMRRRRGVKRRRNFNEDVVATEPTPSTSLSSGPSKKDQMRLPNPSAVTDALVAELLPKSVTGTFQERKHHDVILQTSDNHKIPALKAILAIRSPFFSTLLYGPFAESASKTVAIDLPLRSLTQILHFIYSDDSPVLRRIDDAIRKSGHGFKHRRSAWASLRCGDFLAAIDVIAAADFCQIHTLTNWGCGIIMRAVRVKRGLACIALQAIIERGGVCDQLAEVKEKLFQYIVKYSQGCFAFSFDPESNPLAARECFGHAGKCGVMHLGEDAFKLVFDRLKQSDSDWLRMAITFHCLYFWATGGGRPSSFLGKEDGEDTNETSRGKEEKDEHTQKSEENGDGTEANGKVAAVAPGDVVEDPAVGQASSRRRKGINRQSSRWKTAMACAEVMEAPSSEFLVTVMEPSGLLSPNALLRFYRELTKKNAAMENKIAIPTALE